MNDCIKCFSMYTVLSSNAGTMQEFSIPFYRSIGGVKISIGFYEIQCKYIKEHVDNVGLEIQNIHTPSPTHHPRDGHRKFLGGGWAKEQKFSRGTGVPTRRIFHRVVKDAIDRTRHTLWIFLICSITKIRSRCPFKKKKFKMFVSNVFFFAGSSLSSPL